jgi:hypothetical protein
MQNLGYLFPIYFVSMFVFVLFFLSKKGWADLAKKYQFDGVFDGTRFGIISASINGVNYNSSLVLKYNEEGFYLRPILIFRLFHKAIFVPWQEIKDIRDKKMFLAQLKELVIGDPFVALMQVRQSTFEELEQKTFLNSRVRSIWAKKQ